MKRHDLPNGWTITAITDGTSNVRHFYSGYEIPKWAKGKLLRIWIWFIKKRIERNLRND